MAAGLNLYYVDGQNTKSLSLLDAQVWRDVLGWDINPQRTINAPDAYTLVGWLNRCVHLRASTLAALPWSIYRGEDELFSHDVELPAGFEWLESFPDLLYLAESALCIYGWAYWAKIMSRGRRIQELRWWAPDTTEPVYDASRGITGYKRKVNHSVVVYPPEMVVYFKLPNPLHETRPGVAPVQAALDDLRVIYNVNQFATQFFARGAIKATLLAVPANTKKDDRDRLKAWYERFMTGLRNAWGNAVINADAITPVTIGEGISELANTALTTEKREAVATALGVPHSLVLSNASNFATAEADRLNLYDTTIIPEAERMARTLNRQLFRPLGLRLQFRADTLSLYQEDEEQRAQSFAHYVAAGLPKSLVAEMLGLKLPDGWSYEMLDEQPEQPEVATQPADTAQEPEEEQPDEEREQEVRRFRRWAAKRRNPDPAKFASAILSDADKRALLVEMEAATAQPPFELPDGPITPEWVKAMILQLDDDDDEAEQQIRMLLEKRTVRNLTAAMDDILRDITRQEPESVEQFVQQTRPHFERDRALYDALSRALQDGADLGVSVTVSQLERIGLGFDWTLVNLAARDWAQAYAGTLIRDIEQTTLTGVRQAVSRWITNQEPLNALVQDLTPLFGKQRAELIASTEVTRAFAEASRIAYRQSAVVQELEWRAARDERVCVICGPRHGRRAPLDAAQIDGVGIPAHPRCRCWWVAVVPEPED